MKRLILVVLASLMASMSGYAQLYDLVVAKDGTGDFTKIQDAIHSVEDYRSEGRLRIFVKKGIYDEKVIVPTSKTNISLIGEDRNNTVISSHGSSDKYYETSTLRVEGAGFECEDMTVVNDAKTGKPAVAVYVDADRTAFRNCCILGRHNTLFNGNEDSRQMFYGCYIEGDVDFIFGPATVWFEQCTIHALAEGCYTAASTPATHPVGYIFNKCRFSAEPSVKKQYLGRPWRKHAAVALKECALPACIAPEGWFNGGDPANETTVRYYEYKNSGEGAGVAKRVKWSKVMDATNAAHLTVKRVFQRKSDTWESNALPNSFQRLHFAFCDQYRGKGTAYVANTLEPAEIPADPANAIEELVIKLDGVDCTTFVEYMSAAILGRVYDPTPQDSIMQRFVQALRYRDGKRGNYATRKHYFTDWVRDNVKQGMMTNVTETCDGVVRKKKPINYMSTHTKSYPQLAASPKLVEQIRKVEAELSATEMCYIPCSRIIKNYPQLREGDIVAFVTSTPGLDVQHVGMVWRPDPENDRPQLMHASSVNGRVLITNATVADYAFETKNCIGIMIIRLNEK